MRNWFPNQSDVEFAVYELNVRRSNELPLRRPIPDFRPAECDRKWESRGLPDVSVIIPVYNEAWSMLLRALHSLLDRTPERLLREIIIVDDQSAYEYLGDPLRRYTEALSGKIRILRSRRREGLIRARLRGAREAQGGVLVFLDGHTEVNVGWLEPLLSLIVTDRTTLALPQIDSIDVTSIAYDRWNYAAHGGFTWGMEYVWKYLPPQEAALHRKSPAEPFRSPTALGCALAIDRKFFFDVGAFDDGMYIWGGENIELSFRTWLCGGSIYVAPCSRVGHAFRRWLPYAFPAATGGASVKRRNYQRLVDVWLDDRHRKYYYAVNEMVPSQDLDDGYRKSLSARRRLRKRLECRRFAWYMQNVVPEMAVPEVGAVHFGQIENLAGNDCVTSSSSNGNEFLAMTSCGWHDVDHSFSFMADSTIRRSRREEGNDDSLRERTCLTALAEGYAALAPCVDGQTNQRWTFDVSAWTSDAQSLYRSYVGIEASRTLRYVGKLSALNDLGSVVCLAQVTLPGGSRQIAGLLRCNSNRSDDSAALFQFWHFSHSYLQWNGA